MAERTQEIFELDLKLFRLQEWASKANRPDLASARAIARTTGINRETLNSAVRNGKLSRAHQDLLAAAFGFSPTWSEWVDTENLGSGPRRDTAGIFIDRFKLHKAKPKTLTIAARPTENYLDRRFADFSFDLAHSDQAAGEQSDIALSLSLAFDQRGLPILSEDLKEICNVWLKQVDLQMEHTGRSGSVKAHEIIPCADSEANFHAVVEGLGPWWVVRPTVGDERFIRGRRIGNGSRDCVCQGFSPGDKLHARMTARVNGCSVALSERPVEGETPEKLAVFEQMLKIRALKGKTEVVLGEQILMVVDKT